jgi:uncharacterized protein involved in exopolysaccharide biosynthesis/Mrp family chromosome partitioning ATPase
MSVASQLTDPEFDLPALGVALWRRKWAIIGPTILVALVTLGVVQIIPPKYQSEARLLIEQRGNIFLRPDADKDISDRGTVDQEAVTSQVQLVLSRDLASEVIAKLKLNERPEFDPMLAGLSPVKDLLGALGLIKDPRRMTPEERVLESYYDRLSVFAIEKSRVIVIDFLSEDPNLAARVANAIADAYLVRQRGAKREEAQAAGQWLSGEIESMQKRVADAEAKVANFRGKTNLLVGPNNTTLSAQQLGDVSTQVAAARAQKSDAEARAKLIRDMLRSGEPIESSDILNSELIRRLSEQRVTLRAQLAEQSSSLLDGHPRIKELKAQIADLDHQIRGEAETLARSLENDAKLASARVDSLSSNLDQVKSQAEGSNEQDVHLRMLERDAKAQRDLLESYLAKYREAAARENSNSEPADARVISRGSVSNIPAYPKKLPTVVIATLAALVLSAGWVVTRELLGAPLAAGALAGNGASARRAARSSSRGASADAGAFAVEAPLVPTIPVSAMEDIILRLRQSGAIGGRVAVIAAAPGIDTAAAALKLARALAENNARVVLVGLGGDDDKIRVISNDPKANGLFELIAGRASFGDVITRDRLSGVNLIVSGRAAADRLVLLASPGLAGIFAALGRSYDHVIVDAGLLGGVEMDAIGDIAPHALLLTANPTDGTAAAARDRLLGAGFDEVTVLAAARGGASGFRAVAA